MTIEIITRPSCGKCHFFVAEGGAGRCYRFPRQRAVILMPGKIAGSVEAVENVNYPLQAPNDWCGEFKKAEMPPTEGRA